MDAKLFNTKAIQFLENLQTQMKAEQVQFDPHWDVDHICYRADSLEKYLHLKSEFSKFSELLIETDVNGRPIATYKLHQPIQFFDWYITIVELPAPKPNKIIAEGFEHIEVVCDMSFENLKKRFLQCSFNESGAKKLFNAELEMIVGGVNIKFHHISLESVVRLEKNTSIWKAIQTSQVLQILSDEKPLIVGTFPLGVNLDTSDVDIVIQFDEASRDQILNLCMKHWGDLPEFNVTSGFIDSHETLTINFLLSQIRFEIFAQQKETVQQNAQLHFQAEERILKLGGAELANQIMHLRTQGLKTEPAFTQALKLKGSPYEVVLNLHSKTNDQLLKLIKH